MEVLVSSVWIITLLSVIAIFYVHPRFKAGFAVLAIILNSGITSWMAWPAFTGQEPEFTLNAGSFIGDILIRIDGLSAWFILIINFISIMGVVYGSGYLKTYRNPAFKLTLHWSLFIFFHLSMVWVCMLQNGFAFLLAWEIMSLTSMLLVIFDHDKAKTLRAGINYLVQMHISVVFLTLGFIWVYNTTGSFSFEAIGESFKAGNNFWLFLIFFIGFGLKAGFIPLHSWLPLAHPAAPSHISGVMSGVIVKMGIYGIFRMAGFLNGDFKLIGEMILTLSLLTGVYGILNAAVHRDFKRMLAYCTIENIGIIGIGIGIGLIGIGTGSQVLFFLGFAGALLHVLNHSLFKSLLFFAAGSVYQQTHSRNMDKLGGLIRSMPRTAVVFLIGAVAIGGIPPFNGFVSEFVIFSGLIEGLKADSLPQLLLFVLSLAGMSIIGGVSVLTFTKTFGTIFLGTPRETLPHKPQEVSHLMLIPQYVIIVVMLSIGFLPRFYMNAVEMVVQGIGRIPLAGISDLSAYSGTISGIGIYSLLLMLLIASVWFVRMQVLKRRSVQIDVTWGCGYTSPNSRMQYTGKSFSKPLGKIFNFLMIERKQYRELEKGEVFPVKRVYKSYYYDFLEIRFIDSIVKRIPLMANWFSFIQNGRIQSYVLYGIVFILAILILTVTNFVACC
ncbi:MAG: proton-conducting transporter membrane subunit [Bacteroidota bacterium]